MPFPIDSPALKVEVLNSNKEEEQHTAPAPPQALPPTQFPPPGGKKP